MSFKRNWTKLSKWFLTRPNTSGTLVFLLLLLFVFFLVKFRYNVAKENQHREMSNIINVVQQNFEQVLKNSYVTTLTLAMTVNDEGKPENFDRIAAQLVNSNPSIDAVQLVPNGVIQYVYPFEANEAAIGYDILNSPKVKQEALKSIETKLIYFAGPLKLKQGGMGVVGRLPVFMENKFWGFSAVIIRLETLIKVSGIESIDDSKYYFQFSKVNPTTRKEEFFLSNKTDFSDHYFQTVTIPDGDWKLYLIAREKNALIYQVFIFFFFGFLLSLLFALWVVSIMKKPAQLQKKVFQQAQKIHESETEFKTLFEQAPVGIAKVDSDNGDFITVNSEFCRIVGYPEEELTNSNFQKITHPDDLENNINCLHKLKDGSLHEFAMEKRYLHKSGRTVWVNVIVSKLWKSDGNVKCNIAIVEDITDKKRAEEELKQSFQLVSDQNKRLLNFSYIVSHNLRSHTSNIQTISDFLESAETKEERDEMIDLLKRVSDSLNETMSNLNEVVSIRTNINLSIEHLNLNEYIEKAKLILGQQILKKEALVQNLVSKTIVIDYNAAYLESILFNMISNAIRYSHNDRKPEIILSFDEETKSLKIQDNGIGIDLKKNGDKLFGMYKTFNNNPDSKGIGLFLVKNQVDAMGGKIRAESKLNEGTTFTIYFK
ncbi:PAS domain S-box protein [Flavobacterium wongokense]|uniref:PAS domain S-box protein n=1 Tax=Flavobacterium wongokense TaxID=2910674 RepID=UPI001F316A5B|nr:PAS domain S-box protein [Flavobacterium sp. WG47]MCF6130667.1 PAS domain S-box protein [Flavobacterium sp. WG47]